LQCLPKTIIGLVDYRTVIEDLQPRRRVEEHVVINFSVIVSQFFARSDVSPCHAIECQIGIPGVIDELVSPFVHFPHSVFQATKVSNEVLETVFEPFEVFL
jgi:hypothetical protein